MRVLMTADCAGGVWTYALALADGLADRGVSVTLATMGGPLSEDQRGQLRRSAVERSYTVDLALEWMPGRWHEVDRAGRWLLTIADTTDHELVHLNGYVHATLPWECPVVVVGHSCVLSWYEAVRGTAAPPEWDRYATEVREGVAAADLLVAPTRAMLDALVRLYGPTGPTAVIPNGLRAPRRPKCRKEPLILAAGRVWDEAKNVSALARVASALDWPVAVAGEGAVEGSVVCLGWLSRRELEAWLARAAIFAAPARYEPFGLLPLEAALLGCALVLGDIPSLREVWDDAALYVDPDDDRELAATLQGLIEDPVKLDRFARLARVRAQRYALEQMAHGYCRVYERARGAIGVGAAR
jgi:glycogen synthase